MMVKNIVVGGHPLLEDLQWKMTYVPIRIGGLGFY